MHLISRKGLLAACIFAATTSWSAAADADAETEATPGELLAPAEAATASDMVDRIIFRDETTDQVLDLLERLTGRSVIRPQALPGATFTFNSRNPMTREEAILALQSLLSINGIGVAPMGDRFLKVVPLTRLRSEAPEFLNRSTLDLPASGRIVSRMIQLEFLNLDEVQTQLNLMITQGSGSIIPFPKANAMLITDTVSNLQAIEQLLAEMDRPFAPRTETHFFPIQFARASELVNQIQQLAGTNGVPELSGRTVLTADERSNQIILVADPRQVSHFERLIEKLDVQAELTTRNEVIFLKHATATEVASLLSQLATGRAAGGVGTRPGGGQAGRPGQQIMGGGGGQFQQQTGQQSGQRQRQGNQRQNIQRQQGQPQVPPIPGVRAQQVDGEAPAPAPAEGGLSIEQAEGALGELASSVSGSDFSDILSILADERSNAIIVSGTRQDIQLISELIEKIDIILAQVRIDVFIAEVTLTESDGRGIDLFQIDVDEWNWPSFRVEGPGYSVIRDGTNWEFLFRTAKTRSEVEILSTPTLVTTHNKEANIVVGESRPVITGTISDGSFTGAIRSQVQMMDIAIELRVKPLIGNDGTIQLEIFQKVDDAGEDVEIDGNLQPTIIRREAESFVSVADGEIVILGGLQRTRRDDTHGRLAILGNIPVLGNLFTSQRDSKVRQELLVFIRPTVLPTTGVAHQDAERQIQRQAREEHIRHRMDPEVYPDPYDIEEEEPEEEEVRRPARRGTGAGRRL